MIKKTNQKELTCLKEMRSELDEIREMFKENHDWLLINSVTSKDENGEKLTSQTYYNSKTKQGIIIHTSTVSEPKIKRLSASEMIKHVGSPFFV